MDVTNQVQKEIVVFSDRADVPSSTTEDRFDEVQSLWEETEETELAYWEDNVTSVLWKIEGVLAVLLREDGHNGIVRRRVLQAFNRLCKGIACARISYKLIYHSLRRTGMNFGTTQYVGTVGVKWSKTCAGFPAPGGFAADDEVTFYDSTTSTTRGRWDDIDTYNKDLFLLEHPLAASFGMPWSENLEG